MIKIIGDVHGKIDEYHAITNLCDYSIQIGDLGFFNSYTQLNVNKDRHKFFPGNHDDYNHLPSNCLVTETEKRAGIYTLNGVPFFWISGANSIDKYLRLENRDWWRAEELNFEQTNDCINDYMESKPRIVLSHDCPGSVYSIVNATPKYHTAKLLDQLFEIHKPSIWIFGHHHVSVDIFINETRFICLNELESFDLQ